MMHRARNLLLPLSPVYAAGVMVRNALFDAGILHRATVEMPVIAVGNITAGGVGKTPLVELIVDELRKTTLVGIVSRGYGRKSHGTIVVQDGTRSMADVYEAGDELRQLANRFPNTIIVADERRARGARMAIALGAQVIVLDDGFQHRYLKRNVDIVVMTATQVLHGEWMLPAGNRREPLASLRRADIIAVTRCHDSVQMDTVEHTLSRFSKPILCLRTHVRRIMDVAADRELEFDWLKHKQVIAFSGIGAPESFDQILKQLGSNVIQHYRHRDHHWYTEADLSEIRSAADRHRASAIVTTEKDAVRLRNGIGHGLLDTVPLITVGISHQLARGRVAFESMLKAIEHK